MGSINWPEAVVGFVLGMIPLAARQGYILWKYVKQPSRDKYVGEFWRYHKSTTGSGEIYEGRFSLKYSLFTGRLVIRASDPPGAGPAQRNIRYVGNVSARQGMIRYFELKDPASHERLYWYVIDPFLDPFEKTVGLYIALDLAGLPAAGPMILSRSRLQEKWVADQLGSSTVVKAIPLSSEETISAGPHTI